MRVKFSMVDGGEVEIECKSAYPQFGFFCMTLTDNDVWMIPSHLISSGVEIHDSDPLRHIRVY